VGSEESVEQSRGPMVRQRRARAGGGLRRSGRKRNVAVPLLVDTSASPTSVGEIDHQFVYPREKVIEIVLLTGVFARRDISPISLLLNSP
jgi:hypothetical protein